MTEKKNGGLTKKMMNLTRFVWYIIIVLVATTSIVLAGCLLDTCTEGALAGLMVAFLFLSVFVIRKFSHFEKNMNKKNIFICFVFALIITILGWIIIPKTSFNMHNNGNLTEQAATMISAVSLLLGMLSAIVAISLLIFFATRPKEN